VGGIQADTDDTLRISTERRFVAMSDHDLPLVGAASPRL
jgi:hypothetical protein